MEGDFAFSTGRLRGGRWCERRSTTDSVDNLQLACEKLFEGDCVTNSQESHVPGRRGKIDAAEWTSTWLPFLSAS